ncbi:hypothetical protein RvY_00486 [Ramazzottius varieornatus]|uniref:Reverse transcriptase domain-containing protein n=1 Tax=Ramazzottius varieornatus TaxID=947166 RepID=A0A1D1UJ82_RAMVA|nr:hypothetical protein RvY_00486 [Ramazzottius varieornatus]
MSDINTIVSPGTCLSLLAYDILVSRPQETAVDCVTLQTDLNSISALGRSNQLTFNPTKSSHLRLSRRRSPGSAEYQLDGVVVPTVSTVKYLGLHIDGRLNWTAHWSAKFATARKRIRYLNSLFKYRNSAARIKLFDALVQSLFDYCPSVVWSLLVGTVREIEKCAGKFLRTVRLGVSSSWPDHELYQHNASEVTEETNALWQTMVQRVSKVLPDQLEQPAQTGDKVDQEPAGSKG